VKALVSLARGREEYHNVVTTIGNYMHGEVEGIEDNKVSGDTLVNL